MRYVKLLLLCCIVINVHASRVIMLMGPSCAGKSTLAKYVCTQLNATNEKWLVVDFDEVGENIECLIAATNEYLQNNINVIIDTNTYDNEMEKKFDGAVTIIKIIVTAPLEVLLERDARRTQRLNRDEQRAYWCRHFVIESFKKSLMWSADLIIDSSLQSVQEAYVIIFEWLKFVH
jgi:adenylylsulfate kinase-like enzyme